MVEDDILFTNHLVGKWEIPAKVMECYQTSSLQLLCMTSEQCSMALLIWVSTRMVGGSYLSGLKLSVNIANLCSKLYCREVYQIFRKQTLVFRT